MELCKENRELVEDEDDGHGLGLDTGLGSATGLGALTRGYRFLFTTGLGLPGHKEEFRRLQTN